MDYESEIGIFRVCNDVMEVWIREYLHILQHGNTAAFSEVFFPADDYDKCCVLYPDIKSHSSIRKKIDSGLIKEKDWTTLRDLARARIICTYLSQVKYISEHLVSFLEVEKECEIVDVKNELDAPKDSGYRAYKVEFDVPFLFRGEKVVRPFELQLRTEVQHTWAQREHLLIYKNPGMPKFTKKLVQSHNRLISADLHSIDEKFDFIRTDVKESTKNV